MLKLILNIDIYVLSYLFLLIHLIFPLVLCFIHLKCICLVFFLNFYFTFISIFLHLHTNEGNNSLGCCCSHIGEIGCWRWQHKVFVTTYNLVVFEVVALETETRSATTLSQLPSSKHLKCDKTAIRQRWSE